MTSFWIARLTFDHLLSQLFYRPNYISWPCECSGFAQKSDITKLSESSLFRSHIKENVGCEEIGTSRKAIVFNKKHDKQLFHKSQGRWFAGRTHEKHRNFGSHRFWKNDFDRKNIVLYRKNSSYSWSQRKRWRGSHHGFHGIGKASYLIYHL